MLHPDNVIFSISKGGISHLRLEPVKTRSEYDESESDEFDWDYIFGKKIYMSPEQLAGDQPTMRSDMYALGQMMRIALTGVPQKPALKLTATEFTEMTAMKLRRASNRVKSTEERQILNLHQIIETCLAENEFKRYSDPHDLKKDLIRVKRDLRPLGPSKKSALALWTHSSSGLRRSIVAALLLFMICLSSAWNYSFGHAPPPVVDTLWNKAEQDYRFGDKFAITIMPQEKCYAYLFYIYQNDEAVSLYPSKHQGNNTISPSNPLIIEYLGDYMLKVDNEPGKMIVFSIRESEVGRKLKEELFSDSDWLDTKEPRDHWLSLSGTKLQDRLLALKKQYPTEVFFSLEKAPMATQPKNESQESSQQASLE